MKRGGERGAGGGVMKEGKGGRHMHNDIRYEVTPKLGTYCVVCVRVCL